MGTGFGDGDVAGVKWLIFGGEGAGWGGGWLSSRHPGPEPGSSRRASARRENHSWALDVYESCAADAALLDSCDKHRNDGRRRRRKSVTLATA